jgi:flagellar hook-associated protein 2
MQDVITKYNALLSGYKTASTSTQDSNGTILPAALTGDATSRTIMQQIRAALTGTSAGLPGTSAFQTPASLGIKTNSDGSLSLDTTTFQAAITKDPAAAMRLFTFSGSSDNGILSFTSATDKTATGQVGFTITQTGPGAYSGVFSGTPNGPINMTSSNGTFVGGPGDLEGLTVSVTAAGSGTLTLSRGAGQATRDLISKFTASGNGSISSALTAIQNQNNTLSDQIASAKSALDRRKKVLQAQFSQMEVTIAQMRASMGTLSGA